MNVSQLTHPGAFAGTGLFPVPTQYFPPFEISPYATDLRINRPEGVVQLRSTAPNGPFELTLIPRDSSLYIPRRSCRTTLSVDLVLMMMEHVNFAWVCDIVARHEEGDSVPGVLKRQLFSYCHPCDFVGKRVLDFGCGDGASTMAMAKMLPHTEIVGVELDAERVEVANQIRKFRATDNVSFLCSPSGSQLPRGVGMFDFIMMSAVYEHLLPHERRLVMPLLWSVMKPGAKVFINQTPYRYFPVEAHSTGLWFVNYLPDSLAHAVVRHFAGRNRQINKSRDWDVHLRGGLRGGTEKEIVENLTSGRPRSARIVQPQFNGIRDRASLWLSGTSPNRFTRLKQLIAAGFRLSDRLWGTMPTVNVEVVIEKLEGAGSSVQA